MSIVRTVSLSCLAMLPVLFAPGFPLEAAEQLALPPAAAAQPKKQRDAGAVPTMTLNGVERAGGKAAPDAPVGESGEEGRRWLCNPVAYNIKMRPLAEVLRDFAAGQGVAAKVSPTLTGTVSGMFTFVDPAEFLDVLCRAKHMNWYFDGVAVHFFSDSEMESRLFPLDGASEEMVRNALRDLGFFDSRFEWRSTLDGQLFMVQGPEAYLAKVAEILERVRDAEQAKRADRIAQAELEAREASPGQPREKKLGVFRLKHAWAAERNVTTGDTDASIPGVADILQRIVDESPMPPQQAPGREHGIGAARLMKGTGVIGRANAATQDEPDVSGVAPFIQADTRINAVLVWDYQENLAQYADIIAALDRPLELVEIRAAIVDVQADRSRELGFSWEYEGGGANWQNNAGVNVGSVAVDATGSRSYIPVVGDGLQYATIYTHGLDSFMARVNLLEKSGDANILSRPTVLTQDNIQAVLEHTDTFYVRLQGENEVDLADIKTGLTLKVTPHVIPSDDAASRPGVIESIQLAVHIVNGSNTAETGGMSVDNLPRVQQTAITTQAVVREGEALVIGGYYNETRTMSRTGVPGLSRIPGIGALFRNKSNIATKSERLFVLSPRVVRLGEMPLVPGTEGERIMKDSPGLDRLSVPALDVRSFSTKKSARQGG